MIDFKNWAGVNMFRPANRAVVIMSLCFAHGNKQIMVKKEWRMMGWPTAHQAERAFNYLHGCRRKVLSGEIIPKEARFTYD